MLIATDTDVGCLAPQHKLTLLEMLHRKLLQALELLDANNLTLHMPEVLPPP